MTEQPTQPAPLKHAYMDAEPSNTGKVGWVCQRCGHYTNAPAKFDPCPGVPTQPAPRTLSRAERAEIAARAAKASEYMASDDIDAGPAFKFCEGAANADIPDLIRTADALEDERDRLRAALEEARVFIGVMFGQGADSVIPETVSTPLRVAVKLRAIARCIDAALVLEGR